MNASPSARPALAVFGGSFDPPHRGHFSIVEHVIERNLADRVAIVPAAISPFKTQNAPASGQHRLSMLALGMQALPPNVRGRCEILTLELERAGPSYTIDTLRELARGPASAPSKTTELPALLIGSDSLSGLENWRESGALLANHRVLVFARPGDRRSDTLALCADLSKKYPGPGVQLLDNPLVDCSSTALRAALTHGQSVSDCLGADVLEYVLTHRLYSGNPRPL